MSKQDGFRRGDTQVLYAEGPKYFGAKEGWLLEEEVEKVVVGGPNGQEIYPKLDAVLRPYEEDVDEEKTQVDALPFAELHQAVFVAAGQSGVKENSVVAPLPPPPPVGNQPVSPPQASGEQDVVNEEVWFASVPVEEIVPPSLVKAMSRPNAGLFMLAGMLAALLIGVLCMGVVAWKRGAIGQEAITPRPTVHRAQTELLDNTSVDNSNIIPVHLVSPGDSSPLAAKPPTNNVSKRKKVCAHSLSCPCKQPGGHHAKRTRHAGRIT